MFNPVERASAVCRMREHETATITVGTNHEESRSATAVAEEFENVFACVGIHPVDGGTEQVDETLRGYARHDRVVAIGECGLDYFAKDGQELPPKATQVALFEAQIELAIELEKPLMLHIRPSDKQSVDAYEDALNILEPYAKKYGEKLRGNAHFFVGDETIARRFLDIGFTVSFTGVITLTPVFNEVVRYIPQDMLHAETDAPFVAPEPHRGETNEPIYVSHVVAHIAKLRGDDPTDLAATLLENGRRVFNLRGRL